MSSRLMRRTCTGSMPVTGLWPAAIGASRLHRLAPWMPLCTGSKPASAPWACTRSVIRRSAGMSESSHSRPSAYGDVSELGWISTSSVQTTAQPPSALTPRISASAVGSRWPMPLQWGTWKKRLRAVTGPIWTGSNRMSYRGSRVMAVRMLGTASAAHACGAGHRLID